MKDGDLRWSAGVWQLTVKAQLFLDASDNTLGFMDKVVGMTRGTDKQVWSVCKNICSVFLQLMHQIECFLLTFQVCVHVLEQKRSSFSRTQDDSIWKHCRISCFVLSPQKKKRFRASHAFDVFGDSFHLREFTPWSWDWWRVQLFLCHITGTTLSSVQKGLSVRSNVFTFRTFASLLTTKVPLSLTGQVCRFGGGAQVVFNQTGNNDSCFANFWKCCAVLNEHSLECLSDVILLKYGHKWNGQVKYDLATGY